MHDNLISHNKETLSKYVKPNQLRINLLVSLRNVTSQAHESCMLDFEIFLYPRAY